MGNQAVDWIMNEINCETNICEFCEKEYDFDDSDADDNYLYCSMMCENDVKSESGGNM